MILEVLRTLGLAAVMLFALFSAGCAVGLFVLGIRMVSGL